MNSFFEDHQRDEEWERQEERRREIKTMTTTDHKHQFETDSNFCLISGCMTTYVEWIQKLEAMAAVAFEVRKAQRKYFKTRKQDDLVESKRLEAALDLRLAELGLR